MLIVCRGAAERVTTQKAVFGRCWHEYEMLAAKERQGTRNDLKPVGNMVETFPQSSGKSRDKAGARVGVSGKAIAETANAKRSEAAKKQHAQSTPRRGETLVVVPKEPLPKEDHHKGRAARAAEAMAEFRFLRIRTVHRKNYVTFSAGRRTVYCRHYVLTSVRGTQADSELEPRRICGMVRHRDTGC